MGKIFQMNNVQGIFCLIKKGEDVMLSR